MSYQQYRYRNPQLQSYKPLSDFQESHAESIQRLQTRHWKEPEYLLHEDFLQVSSPACQHRMGVTVLLKLFRRQYEHESVHRFH